MPVYGIGLDVYVIVLAELIGALTIIIWALKSSKKEKITQTADGNTAEVEG